MNNKVVIDEDIWGLIINLCFRLNELKHISVDEPSPQTLLFAFTIMLKMVWMLLWVPWV